MAASYLHQDEHNPPTLVEGQSVPNITIQFSQLNLPPTNIIPIDIFDKKIRELRDSDNIDTL